MQRDSINSEFGLQNRLLKIAHLLALTLAILAVSLLQNGLQAATTPHAEIEQQIETRALSYLAERYPQTEINLTLTPINTSLDLPQCNSPLDIRFPYANEQRLTARVTCAGPKNWSIFVTARLELWRQAVVAARPITKGTRITASMLTFGRVDISRSRSNYFTALDQITGQTTKRAIATKQAISSTDLEPSLLVRRGEQVILEAIRAGTRISVKAIALEDGRLNEQIRVKNQRSEREVIGRIVGPGLVRSN